MSVVTFEQIAARVAAHQVAEAARNAPVAVARRAAFALRSVLSDLAPDQRREILELLAVETAELAPVVA